MSRRLGMLLKVKLLDLLPASHDSSSSTESNIPPHVIKIAVVNDANVFGVICECGELVALRIVVVVDHGIRKPTDNRLCDVCGTKRELKRKSGKRIWDYLPLFFGWVDLE